MMKSKPIPQIISVQPITDLENFEAVNYVKRSGGQIFQHYSLLEPKDLYSTDYRETEVIFSREIYKKRVYTSIIFPLFTVDSSTNAFVIPNPAGTLKERLLPSYFERTANALSVIDGELRVIFKAASMKAETILNSLILTTGELRLPLITYTPKQESITNNIKLVNSILKRVLINANNKIESILVNPLRMVVGTRSTITENDVTELNFEDKAYPEESYKTTSSILNKYSTIVDSSKVVSGSNSIRLLNNYGGFINTVSGNSISLNSIYDWTINFNFYPRDLIPGSYLFESDFLSVYLNTEDSSILNVKCLGQSFKSNPLTINLNTWYNLSVEMVSQTLYIYVNNNLLFKSTPLTNISTIFTNGSTFSLGNSRTGVQGFIGNIDKFIITKKLGVVTNSVDINTVYIKPVIGSNLYVSNNAIVDDNPNITWNYYSGLDMNADKTGIRFIAGQYAQTIDVADLNIYDFNNFKIELTFSSDMLPTLANPIKTIVHKTGSLKLDEIDINNGYYLNIEYIDIDCKLVFNSSNNKITSNTSIKQNVKYFVEIFKYKKYLVMFIDGVFENIVPYTSSRGEDPLSQLVLGKYITIPGQDFRGTIYNIKFINYYRDNTNNLNKYLPENLSISSVLNFETNLYDEDSSTRVWTSNNPTYLDTTKYKFGSSSLALNTTNKFIKTETDPVFNVAKKDFTFESWINPTSFNTVNTLIANGVKGNSNINYQYRSIYLDTNGYIVISGNKDGTGFASDIIVKSSKPVPLNQWSHVVIERSSNIWSIYINGTRTDLITIPPVNFDLSIGGTYVGNNIYDGSLSNQLNGNLDSFRFVNGKALYAASFNVPTKPVGTIDINLMLDLSFDDVIYNPKDEFLLNFNPVLNSSSVDSVVLNTDMSATLGNKIDTFILNFENYFTDEGNLNMTPSLAETGLIKDNIAKFGTKSYYLDNHIGFKYTDKTADKNIFIFDSSDFTIEYWLYETARSGNTALITDLNSTATSGNVGGCIYGYNGTFYVTNLFSFTYDSSVAPLNTWNHYAFTRQNNIIKAFINGKKLAEKTVDSSFKFNDLGTNGTIINGFPNGGGYVEGYLDALRVIRGTSLYNTDFNASSLTVPAQIYKVSVGIDASSVDNSNYIYNNKSIKLNKDKPLAYLSTDIKSNLISRNEFLNADINSYNTNTSTIDSTKYLTNNGSGWSILKDPDVGMYCSYPGNANKTYGEFNSTITNLLKTSNFTIAFKCRIPYASTNGDVANNSTTGYILSASWDTGVLSFVLSTHGFDYNNLADVQVSKDWTKPFALNKWQEIIISYQNNKITVIKDGVIEVDNVDGYVNKNITNPLTILRVSARYGSYYSTAGDIADFRIYNKGFSSQDLFNAFANTKSLGIFSSISNTDDFTFEEVIKLSGNDPYQVLIYNSTFTIYRSGIDNKIKISSSTLDNVILSSNLVIQDNTWYILAVTRNKGILTIFINGMKDSRISDNTLAIKGNVYIGTDGINYATGNIESLRFIPKVSLYNDSYNVVDTYFTKENSNYNLLSYNNTSLYEESRQTVVSTITNPNISMSNGTIYSTLPQDSSVTYTTIPSTYVPKVINNDFTLEIKAKLLSDRWSDILANFKNWNSSYPAVLINLTDTYTTPSTDKSIVNTFLTIGQTDSNNIKSPLNIITPNTWYTIAITRQGSIYRTYVNGNKIGEITTTANVELSNPDLYLLGTDSNRSNAALDYVYILKGKALYTDNSYILQDYKSLGINYETKTELISSTDFNTLSDKTFFENISVNNATFVKNKKGFYNSALYFDNSYLKMDNFPAVPSSNIFECWIKPYNTGSNQTIFNLVESVTTGLVITLNTNGSITIGYISTNSISIVGTTLANVVFFDEWNKLKISLTNGIITILVNGYVAATFTNSDPNFFHIDASTLYLGKNYKGYIDDITFRKFSSKDVVSQYEDSLNGLFTKHSLTLNFLPLLNTQALLGTSNWNVVTGNLLISTKDKNYFSTNNSVLAYQDIDLSSYINMTGKRLYLVYDQLSDSMNDKGRVYLEYLDKDRNSMFFIRHNTLSVSSVAGRISERYLHSLYQPQMVYIRVWIELNNNCLISNIKLYTEDLGKSYIIADTKVMDYIEQGSLLDNSYGYTYTEV